MKTIFAALSISLFCTSALASNDAAIALAKSSSVEIYSGLRGIGEYALPDTQPKTEDVECHFTNEASIECATLPFAGINEGLATFFSLSADGTLHFDSSYPLSDARNNVVYAPPADVAGILELSKLMAMSTYKSIVTASTVNLPNVELTPDMVNCFMVGRALINCAVTPKSDENMLYMSLLVIKHDTASIAGDALMLGNMYLDLPEDLRPSLNN